MDPPTGQLPASDIPKTLQNILDVLLCENGVVSWQIYSQTKGVSLRIKFGEAKHGGQTITTGNSRTCYSKKSPSQMRRDARKSEERRVTRQQTRRKKDQDVPEVEKPRGDCTETMNSPLANHAWSPSPVDLHNTPAMSSPMSMSSLVGQSGHSHVGQTDCLILTKTTTQSADCDMHNSTPVDGSTRVDAEVSGTDSEYSDDDERHSEVSICSENNRYGPNLSKPRIRYMYLKPVDRRCSYCGAYKGSIAEKIMECSKDGRKVCLRCYGDCHVRHRKYFTECKTNYVHDGDSMS